MKVYLVDPCLIQPKLAAFQRDSYQEILACAHLDQRQHHSLVSQPDEADLIIAPIQFGGYGPFLETLKKSHFYQTYRDKMFVYCMDDEQYPSLPGVYPAIRAEWVRQGWALGGHYLSHTLSKFDFACLPPSQRDILFSFAGSSRTHPIREKVLQLNHPRSFLFDSSPKTEQTPWYNKDQNTVQKLRQQFQDVITRSQFVLCPRGIAPSSIRVFEAMQAGCVPVIIADELVLPQGPNWQIFSVVIAEKEIATIPKLLEQLEPRFADMSLASRKAWEGFFSPQASFETLVDWCAQLKQGLSTKNRNFEAARVQVGEVLRVQNVRVHLRHFRLRYLSNTPLRHPASQP